VRRTAAVVLVAALVAVLAAAPAASAQRARWNTRVLALVPKPGFPAHAYVHPNGRIYAGTYTNPNGDTVPSRVFEYDGADGTLLRSWTLEGQNLEEPHGVQAATSDVRGRIVLLDKSPPRALLLDRATGAQIPYAGFPPPTIPNYAAWGPDGSLYVTDYERPILWRVPPGGGVPEQWLQDPRLDGGGEFGTTGLELGLDRASLLVAQQSEAGGSAGNPTTGRLFHVPINPDGKPGQMTQLWESDPVDGPDGFDIAKSGNVYLANLGSNQIVVIGPGGNEIERFPAAPGSGENGSSVPFDSPSSVSFLGTRAIVAQQAFFTGDPAHQAILDVETGEEGRPELIPANAGLADAVAPRLTGVRLDARRLTLTIDERAEVDFVVERRDGRVWRVIRRSFRDLRARIHVLSLTRLANKRKLRPALYRVTMVAKDESGNESEPLTLRVRVPRR
jgi:sugar lactone lactonase YvrE